MKPQYCIIHERLVYPELMEYIPKDCIFTSCPPPDEFDLDGWEWTMSLPVPDAEEMAQMDESAEALQLDLQGDLS